MNKNHFVSRSDYDTFLGVRVNYTLQDIIEEYNDTTRKIKALEWQKKEYERLMEEEPDQESEQLSFKEEERIFGIVDYLARNESRLNVNWRIDLIKLRSKLERAFPRVKNYNQATSRLRWLKAKQEEILLQDVNFDTFLKDFPLSCTLGSHVMVRYDGQLKCICCGATTKEYGLNEEELDFLTKCAMKQGLLLKEITQEEMPFVKVLIEKLEYEHNRRINPDPFDDTNEEEEEMLWTLEKTRTDEIQLQINLARFLDAKIYESEKMRIKNPKYFSDEKTKELLSNVEKELEKIQKSDSRFKNLIIEEWKTAKYEILILSGAHIPTLLEQAQTEEDKIALTKGYYNLMDADRRVASGYFEPSTCNRIAVCYDCVTANPEINNRILEMKVRR